MEVDEWDDDDFVFQLSGLAPRQYLQAQGKDLRPVGDLRVTVADTTTHVVGADGREIRFRLTGPLPPSVPGAYSVTVRARGRDYSGRGLLVVYVDPDSPGGDGGPDSTPPSDGAPPDQGDTGQDAPAPADADSDGQPPYDGGSETDGAVDGCPAACADQCRSSCPDTATECACTNSCPCQITCADADCVAACYRGTACHIEASGSRSFTTRCQHGAICTVVARESETVDFHCMSGDSSCDIDCRDTTTCLGDCTAGATCLLRCSEGGVCDFNRCDGIRTACDDDLVVCNRDCP
jgi:hypothetical protein